MLYARIHPESEVNRYVHGEYLFRKRAGWKEVDKDLAEELKFVAENHSRAGAPSRTALFEICTKEEVNKIADFDRREDKKDSFDLPARPEDRPLPAPVKHPALSEKAAPKRRHKR